MSATTTTPAPIILPTEAIILVLMDHGVPVRVVDGVVQGWEASSLITYRDGVRTAEDTSEWVAVPTEAFDLALWLGY